MQKQKTGRKDPHQLFRAASTRIRKTLFWIGFEPSKHKIQKSASFIASGENKLSGRDTVEARRCFGSAYYLAPTEETREKIVDACIAAVSTFKGDEWPYHAFNEIGKLGRTFESGTSGKVAEFYLHLAGRLHEGGWKGTMADAFALAQISLSRVRHRSRHGKFEETANRAEAQGFRIAKGMLGAMEGQKPGGVPHLDIEKLLAVLEALLEISKLKKTPNPKLARTALSAAKTVISSSKDGAKAMLRIAKEELNGCKDDMELTLALQNAIEVWSHAIIYEAGGAAKSSMKLAIKCDRLIVHKSAQNGLSEKAEEAAEIARRAGKDEYAEFFALVAKNYSQPNRVSHNPEAKLGKN